MDSSFPFVNEEQAEVPICACFLFTKEPAIYAILPFVAAMYVLLHVRHPLHPATRKVDDHLQRRTGTRSGAELPFCARIVSRWLPHSGGAGLRSEAGEDLGLGNLRVRDGKELTRCAASRNSKGRLTQFTMRMGIT